jgi:cyclohexadieny/prephenate dehydrogenase
MRCAQACRNMRISMVPGHPLAGTEHSGPDAGFATLFQRPLAFADAAERIQGPAYPEAVDQLEAFWRALGANVERMDAGAP